MILALALSSAALALTVEVSPGDDIATITSALAAGDEIIFNDGVFQISDNLTWTGQGTADAPIVLRAADGASPIIELVPTEKGAWDSIVVYVTKASFFEIRDLHIRGGAGWNENDASFHGLYLSETSDILIADVEVSQTGRNSVQLANNNARITLSRPHLHDTRDGDAINAGCSDASCFLTDSVVSQAWIHGINGSRHAIYMAHGSQGNRIEDSVIYDLEYRGVYLGSTEFGEPNVLARNAIWEVGDWGVTLYGAARVRNNLIFTTGNGGIYAGDPERGAFEDLVISYNTVLDTIEDAVELDDWTNAPGMVLSSNALCNPVGLGVDVERQADPKTEELVPFLDALITNNVVCGYVTGISEDEGHLVPGSGYADYLDVAGWSLYPTRDSALRDIGDASSGAWVPETDFNGTARPGDAPDVGAYEWTQDDNPGWVIQQSYKSLDVDNTAAPAVIGGCCSKEKGGDDGGDTGAAMLLPIGLLIGLRRLRRRGPTT